MTYAFYINNLPDDLIQLINSYCNPETDYYRDKILKIANDNGVTRFGFKSKNDGSFNNKNSILNIMRCKDEIPFIIKPMKSVYKVGSYGGKHEIEKYRNKIIKKDNYISNGEFIIAMILNGYVFKKDSNTSLNCSFKAKYINEC